MKFAALLVVAVLAIGASQASLVSDAGSLLDQVEKLPLLLQKSRGSVSLREALGVPEHTELDELETKIRVSLGEKIREYLENLLKHLEAIGSNAAAAIKELLENLFNDPPTAENAEKLIHVLKNLQIQRESVGRTVEHLDLSNSRDVAFYAVEVRGFWDWWDNIKDWFSGVGSWISDKYDKFKDWAKDIFDKVIDASKPLVDQVKDLAIEFLKENWDTLSVELVKQALEFFWPNSGAIGEQVMNQLIELARKFGLVPWEQLRYLLPLRLN